MRFRYNASITIIEQDHVVRTGISFGDEKEYNPFLCSELSDFDVFTLFVLQNQVGQSITYLKLGQGGRTTALSPIVSCFLRGISLNLPQKNTFFKQTKGQQN